MFYLIYKTTNNVNGKCYYGKHQTKDLNDGYLGSGTMLKRAIKKYGSENFTRDDLVCCLSEDDMNLTEAFFVTQDVVDDPNTYNLMIGGQGGDTFSGRKHTEQAKKRMSAYQQNKPQDTAEIRKNKSNGQLGKKHSRESCEKRSKSFSKFLTTEKGKEELKRRRQRKLVGTYYTPMGQFETLAEAASGNNCTIGSLRRRLNSTNEKWKLWYLVRNNTGG